MHGPEAGLVEEEEYTLDDDDDTTDGDDDEDDDNEADDGQGPVGPLPSPSVRDVVSLSGADEVDYFFVIDFQTYLTKLMKRQIGLISLRSITRSIWRPQRTWLRHHGPLPSDDEDDAKDPGAPPSSGAEDEL